MGKDGLGWQQKLKQNIVMKILENSMHQYMLHTYIHMTFCWSCNVFNANKVITEFYYLNVFGYCNNHLYEYMDNRPTPQVHERWRKEILNN